MDWREFKLMHAHEWILVNMANISYLRREGEGTRIYFAGGEAGSIVVAPPLEEIVPQSIANAAKT